MSPTAASPLRRWMPRLPFAGPNMGMKPSTADSAATNSRGHSGTDRRMAASRILLRRLKRYSHLHTLQLKGRGGKEE